MQREKEQRNFWRFKHESFRRGRKDLLREIKRSASSSSSSGANGGNNAAAAAAVSPNANTLTAQTASPSPNNTSNTTAAITPAPQEVTRLNTEVNTLKEQMQSMATKMDDLTCLVKGMNVSPPQVGGGAEVVSVGNKRKKVDTDDSSLNVMMPPEDVPSSTMMTTETKMEQVDVDIILPFASDDNNIHMSLEDAATTLLPDLTLSNGPSSLVPTPVLSRCSSLPDVSPDAAMGGEEEDFVDELFHAFATDDTTATAPPLVEENPNKPDPQLMKRIEDSLSTIPKTMHEMVANRLIDAIAEGSSSTTAVCSSSCSEGATIVRSPSCESSVATSPKKSVDKENTLNRSSSSIIPEGATTAEAEQTSIPLPLAIATLKTILADYGLKVECGSSSEDANLHRRLSNKSLPLVPIHA